MAPNPNPNHNPNPNPNPNQAYLVELIGEAQARHGLDCLCEGGRVVHTLDGRAAAVAEEQVVAGLGRVRGRGRVRVGVRVRVKG